MDRGILAARKQDALESIIESTGVDLNVNRSFKKEVQELHILERIAEALQEQDDCEIDTDAISWFIEQLEDFEGVGPSTVHKIKLQASEKLGLVLVWD